MSRFINPNENNEQDPELYTYDKLSEKPRIGTLQESERNIIPTGLNAPVSPIKPPKRFNELDIKILEDTAGVELDEVALKLEVKMNTINKEIQLIDEQIRLYCIINPKDKNDKLMELLKKKEECEINLAKTKEEYVNLGDFYRMSHQFAEKIEHWQEICSKKMKDFSQTKIGKMLFGIAPFFRSRKYLNTTVGKLDTLYKKMETIVNLKHIPYGEKDDTMGDLIEFMKTANQLEAKMQNFFFNEKSGF